MLPVFLARITRIGLALGARPASLGMRRFGWRQLTRVLAKEAIKIGASLPSSRAVSQAVRAAGYGMAESTMRSFYRAAVSQVKAFPRQEEYEADEVFRDWDVPETALPITAPYQYEFELPVKGVSGDDTGDWGVLPVKFNSPDLMSASEAAEAFYNEFQEQFTAKWEDMVFIGVVKPMKGT